MGRGGKGGPGNVEFLHRSLGGGGRRVLNALSITLILSSRAVFFLFSSLVCQPREKNKGEEKKKKKELGRVH